MKDSQGNHILYKSDDVIIKWLNESKKIQCFSNSGNTKGMMLDTTLIDGEAGAAYYALLELCKVHFKA